MNRLWPVAALAALAGALAWLLAGGSGDARTVNQAAAAPAPAPPRPLHAGAQSVTSPPPATRGQLLEQLQLADHTYCSYRAATRYPHASRPAAEQGDQLHPNAPVTDAHPMRLDGGGTDKQVLVQTSQSRVYLAAGEAVAFSLRAVDADGKVLPLVVTRALAQGMAFNGARPAAQAVLAFADDGAGADPVAGDGAYAAVLAPAQTGLATFHGTIRTEVRYSVGARTGAVLFDVVYSPELSATWTGQVREAIEDGSLNFYLKAEVRQPGRYVVTGRLDDAGGRPFALVTFNDLLAAGTQEVRLTAFGKLLRDQDAALPLTLRDVDGYLLREDADPDRLLMPRLEGKAFVGKAHPLAAFSDAEWQGEERSRYLARFGSDLAQAKAALAQVDPAAPLPKSECVEAANQR